MTRRGRQRRPIPLGYRGSPRNSVVSPGLGALLVVVVLGGALGYMYLNKPKTSDANATPQAAEQTPKSEPASAQPENNKTSLKTTVAAGAADAPKHLWEEASVAAERGKALFDEAEKIRKSGNEAAYKSKKEQADKELDMAVTQGQQYLEWIAERAIDKDGPHYDPQKYGHMEEEWNAKGRVVQKWVKMLRKTAH